ncbi:glycosyltransferase [Pseudoalteromonas carrageenovora]|uniref:glycosyltransferase n=1 Tax=Pseudoalteromonas carrageenovora TaxID=227 RepID=UPI0026E1199C|nr:glycosyltransferase [Pseudoalteromonas carrageenovora]MDO6548918.1 glycosyltransferase [Pseudoalteromonas carrageenovora]MDO6833423.1 glycosyltransferase [Pseudoalteromonas carrageenovora]
MKIVAFVGEPFDSYNGNYYTKQTSAAFLQDAVGIESVYVCSPSRTTNTMLKSFSTKVSQSNFYSFPNYNSTKDFAIKSLFKRGYLKSYKAKADEVIKEHSGACFWIRSPSMGSLLFGIQALKAGERVFHHMCADSSSTWKDPKYSFVEKIFGFLFSKYLSIKLKKICAHKNTVNLCTGDVLEKFSAKYSPKNTHQFVDLMAKKPKNIHQPVKTNNLFKMLFLGRIVEDKGVFDLIEVARQLKDKVQLTIIGDGVDLDRAKQLVALHSLEETVKFTGLLPNNELSEHYSQTDVVVVPSNNHYEGFPRVIMEGWAFNKPVIVSNTGGVKAFVKHNVNGLIFTPGSKRELKSAVNKLLSDERFYFELQAEAEKMAVYSSQDYWVNFLNTLLK